MISDVPLRLELGGGRAQHELTKELRRLGHTVETFDRRDAFGDEQRPAGSRFAPLRFAARATAFVRSNGSRFDVVDAKEGSLPHDRRALRLQGLLVARSVGLHAFYSDYVRFERATWPQFVPGTGTGKLLHRWGAAKVFAAERKSIELCDLAIVPNDDEARYVSNELGLGQRCVAIPFGLSDEGAAALAAAKQPAHVRLTACEVACVGSWCLRKGSADWGAIVAETWKRLPNTRFLFLGTGALEDKVLRDLGIAADERIRVVPSFASDELPELIGGSTVGALPSYVEGGPFAVLELIGAGLPTVAYAAPGARSQLDKIGSLVPAGDVNAFGRRLVELLSLEREAYEAVSQLSAERAATYRWPELTRRTLEAYDSALAGRS